MVHNSFTQYQTSFRVQSKDDRPTLSGLQNIIFGWLCEKEKDRLLHNGRTDFFNRCEWKKLWNTHSTVATSTFYGDTGRAWAFRYTEQDKELGGQRYWYTDIGLVESGNEVIFYARVSYARGKHDLSFESEAPPSTIPRFIRYILSGPYKIYSEKPAFGLFDRPIPVETAGKGKAIADIIRSPSRRYPIILVNGSSEALLKEADYLARALAGKCQVILMGDNRELAEELQTYLPRDLSVRHGKLRVFFRISDFNLNPHRHRFFDPSDPDYPLQRQGIINGLLRNHTLEEDGCLHDISEISQRITLKKLSKFRDENPEKEAEVNEVYALVEQIEKDRDEYKRQADYFAREHDAMEAELRKERAKSAHFTPNQKQAQGAQQRLGNLDQFSQLPKSLAELVTCFAKLFPDRLSFTDSALDEAEEYISFSDINTAWEMLYHLHQTLYDLKFNTTGGIDFEGTFKNKSSYELAMSEGRQTKRNKELMALREITHNGKSYDITPHLKWGNREPKMLRIHFAFDEELQKIIVGYVGPHMENATSRTRK